MSSGNVKPTGVIKLFFDQTCSIWEHVINIPPRPLTSITKGPEQGDTRNILNSARADLVFRHCFFPILLQWLKIYKLYGIINKEPVGFFASTEIGGVAYFALLNKGNKIWCASTSSTGTTSIERCCHSPEGFIELLQCGPREREPRYLQGTLQRPGDLISIPHLLANAVLVPNTGSPTILSGWDAAKTSNL